MKLILLALLAMASVAHGQTRWQLATGYRADSFHTQNIAAFASDVEQATNAALRIEVRPNNSLFKLADIRQAVQDGKVQAGESIMAGMVSEPTVTALATDEPLSMPNMAEPNTLTLAGPPA